MSQDDTLVNLANLRRNLKDLMNPEVLRHLANFLEKTQYGESSLMERYEWFCKNAENGPDCKYAMMAKTFFLRDQADDVAYEINWLYDNWSKNYKT